MSGWKTRRAEECDRGPIGQQWQSTNGPEIMRKGFHIACYLLPMIVTLRVTTHTGACTVHF